jgi:Ca-activated chloride channel family protein
MSFQYPFMVVVALVLLVALVIAYRMMQKQRGKVLAQTGLQVVSPGRTGLRRHVPPILFLVALTLVFLGAARPTAKVSVPRASGTVMLAFDVSSSMSADDVQPSRLAAAQAAAAGFVKAQPDSVDIGVIAFDQGALTTHLPSKNHDETLKAVNRLRPSGGTSLGQAILASMSAIVGRQVNLPDANSNAPLPDLGYWGSATIVLLSDGENTGGPDALAAAELVSDAGVHIDTIGFGTPNGTTVEVDGFQVATALDEDTLTQIAQTTNGSYHRAGDAKSLNDIYKSLDLRITAKAEPMELTGAVVVLGILLLTVGGFLMINSYGRIL